MISIKVNGDFLELPPAAATQVERNTPLILGDENLGELTFPITISATEKNMRLLGFITELGKVKTDAELKIDAEYYEHGLFMYRGTLVAEYVTTNLNHPQRGEISIYFLTAISAFYAAAKNVMLQELDLGGDRYIPGFLNHIKDTWTGNADSFDYVFCPIKNGSWMPDPGDNFGQEYTFMNTVWVLNGVLELETFTTQNRVIPFPYIRYLLIQAFKYFGYTVSGDILNEAEFTKAFTPAFNALYWSYWVFESFPVPSGHLEVLDPVLINLRNHVPQNYPVTKLLFSLGNLFGIAYDINVTTKHCEIRRLNRLPAGTTRKDMTEFVDPSIKSEFQKDKQIYAIKQSFDPSDTRVNRPDLSTYKRIADATDVSQFPPAGAIVENNLILLIPRNWFYVCVYNPDAVAYEWQYLCDNLYDYEPAGNNQTIETSLTPVSQSVVPWRKVFPSQEYRDGLFPHIEQSGNWPGKTGQFANWELRILFYHGLQQDADGQVYPFASSHHYNMAGAKIAGYSLALTPPEGLVEKFWQDWLMILGSMEVVDMVLYLNLKQYYDLLWTDFILIRNIPFLITQLTPQSPYNDRLPVKALRVNLTKYVAPPPTCSATVVNLIAQDNGDGTVTFDWENGSPGATAWQYSIDGGTTLTVFQHPIVILGLLEGQHSVTVIPVCGNGAANPAGGASKTFNLVIPQAKITISAILTTGNGIHNKLRLTATPSHAVTAPIGFNFGQCVFNTTSNLQYCSSYPGAVITPDDYPTLHILSGSDPVTMDSIRDTPGADYGYIVKVVIFGLVNITPDRIIKDPGASFVLQILP